MSEKSPPIDESDSECVDHTNFQLKQEKTDKIQRFECNITFDNIGLIAFTLCMFALFILLGFNIYKMGSIDNIAIKS